jgi:arsenite methyltransferase
MMGVPFDMLLRAGGKMEHTESFFDFAAQVDITKHLGGHQATQKLVQLCRINPDSYVLDVGSGVGVTPCYLAKTLGCRVMGVDLNPNMLPPSLARAKKGKLTDLVEFKTADAHHLPFPDGNFDAVITESVTAFSEDKALAVREYARVTKPGGYIGLNESTWLNLPVPPEVIAWISQDPGTTVQILSADQWVKLLNDAGLEEVTKEISPVDLKAEARGMLDRYGWSGMLRTMGRMFLLYLKNPAYREFTRSVRQTGLTPPNLDEYFGYGIYTGQKK